MANLTEDNAGDNLLMQQFREFYDQLELACGNAPKFAAHEEIEELVKNLGRQLENFIELQTLEVRRGSNRFAQQSNQQALYLKVALADEILLKREWAGRDVWCQHLLETALFRTSIAGEKVFSDIEQMLREREPSQRSLAQLYLFALALGFEGKYRNHNADSHLVGLRSELFQFAFQRPADLGGRDRVLSTQPYASTLSHILPSRLIRLSRWKVFFIFGLLGLLVISELLWLWPTWPLRQFIQGVNLPLVGSVL